MASLVVNYDSQLVAADLVLLWILDLGLGWPWVGSHSGWLMKIQELITHLAAGSLGGRMKFTQTSDLTKTRQSVCVCARRGCGVYASWFS